MTLDQRARAAADELRRQGDTVRVPDPVTFVGQRRRRRLVFQGVAALVCAVLMLGTGFIVITRNDNKPRTEVRAGPSPSASVSGDAESVDVFKNGVCYDASSARVPCSDLHTREEFATFAVHESLSPADTKPIEKALDTCKQLFERYTGVDYGAQNRYTVFFASGMSDVGVTTVRCDITGLRGALDPTTGSARDLPTSDEETTSSPTTATALPNTRAAVAQDGCPVDHPLPPGDDPQAAVVDVVKRDAVAFGLQLPNMSPEADVETVILASYPAQKPAPPEHQFAAAPFSQCADDDVSGRTWVAEVSIPELEPSQSLSKVQYFVARFDDGWKVWGTY